MALLDLQVLHHPVELFQQGLGLGHAALVHQALDLVHHLLDLVAGDLLALLFAAVGAVGLVLRLALLGQHVGIGVGRLAQLVHQALDLVGAGAVADRLGQALLRGAHSFQRVRQAPILQQHRSLPQGLGQAVAGVGGQIAAIQQPHGGAQFGIQVVLDEPFGLPGDGAQDLGAAAGILARPQQVAAQLDQRGRERVEEPPPRQGQRHRIGLARLVDPVHRAQRDGHGQVGPGVAGQILGQLALNLAAIAARQGQVQRHRVARLRRDRQAKAAIDRVQIKGDDRLCGHHAVIVPGLVILDHPPVGAARGCRPRPDHRHGVGLNGHREAAALDVDAARLVSPERRGRRIVRGDRPDILHQVGPLGIDAKADGAALGQLQNLTLGQGVQIQGRAAGIGGRFGPALPDGPLRRGGTGLRRGHRRGQGAHAQPHLAHAAKDQRHDQCHEPCQTQGKRVAPRQIRVGTHRTRGQRGVAHLRQMRLPQRPLATNRGTVRQRGQRTSRQGAVQPGKRLGPAHAAKAPSAPDRRDHDRQQPQPGQPRQHRLGQRRHRAKRQRRDAKEQQRRQRPKGPRRPFPRHAGTGQAQRAAHRALLGCENTLGGPGADGPRAVGLARASDQSHAGMLSRASISSNVGRARMTAK